MSTKLQWLIGICVVLVTAALVFSAVMPLFGWGRGVYGGMMQPGQMFDRGMGGGHMFGGRMGGFGLPFFGLGLFSGPLLLVALVALGAVWLLRGRGQTAPLAAAQPPAPAAAATPCANCGRPLQADWAVCPYCGEKVASAT